MGIIAIKGMEFFSYHGCFSEEQVIGNYFIVDLEIDSDTESAEISDNLIETINYQAVYAVVKIEMEKPSKLIEHVARRIMNSVMSEFGKIVTMRITVSKINPPIGGKTKSVSITLSSK